MSYDLDNCKEQIKRTYKDFQFRFSIEIKQAGMITLIELSLYDLEHEEVSAI